jgi:hypothetical protein
LTGPDGPEKRPEEDEGYDKTDYDQKEDDLHVVVLKSPEKYGRKIEAFFWLLNDINQTIG